jgi:hypothetical protein
LSPEEIRAFKDESQPAVLAITHENYRAEAVIPPEVRRSLAEDLILA